MALTLPPAWWKIATARAYLDEAYVLRVLTEALTAHVQPVFTDQTVTVRADAAGREEKNVAFMQAPQKDTAFLNFHLHPRQGRPGLAQARNGDPGSAPPAGLEFRAIRHQQWPFPLTAVSTTGSLPRARTLAELPWVTPVQLLVTHLASRRPTRKKERVGVRRRSSKFLEPHITQNTTLKRDAYAVRQHWSVCFE